MTALDLVRVIEARSYPRTPGERRKKRVATRFSRADIGRIDALRGRLSIKLSRAQMVRACAFYVLAMAESEGGAP